MESKNKEDLINYLAYMCLYESAGEDDLDELICAMDNLWLAMSEEDRNFANKIAKQASCLGGIF